VWLAGIPSAITCICPEKDLYESLMQKARSGHKLTAGEIKWLATVHMKTQTDKDTLSAWCYIMNVLFEVRQDAMFHNLVRAQLGKCLRGDY
jgi:hypothetical protein